MKTTSRGSLFLRPVSAMLCGVALFCSAPAPARAAVHVLQFTVAAISGVFYLDDPSLNGKPAAKLVVTQRTAAMANDHPIGVFFDKTAGTKGMWAVINEDQANIPVGAGFNVLVGAQTTVHASDANSFNAATLVKTAAGKPPFNPAPTAPAKPGFLFFTHNIVPFPTLGAGVNVGSHQYLFYSAASDVPPPPSPLRNKWCIANIDFSSAVAAGYFVFDASTPPKGATVFGHTTTLANHFGNVSLISNPAADNKPGAVVFITPIGSGAVANKATGVVYNQPKNQWSIFNEDNSSIGDNEDFNVLVFPGPIP